MKKWRVEIAQNGEEYTGWVTFFADEVKRGDYSWILIVDGRDMEFDENVTSIEEVISHGD